MIMISEFLFKLTNFCVIIPETASIAEAAAVTPNGAKIFFAEGAATFISGPANLLNNDPKNLPD